MKTNIKMRVTPEQSMRVQEICFKNGIQWRLSLNTISHINKPYLAIEPTAIFYRSTEIDYLTISSLFQEIDADLFIRTDGTCEENTFNELFEKVSERVNDFQIGNMIEPLDKYAELENKLKKKNEILKKARTKRKNQREELHKLNLKLQKCIGLEEHDLKMKTVLNEKHKLEAENIEMGKLVNLNKSALDLAVMTKDFAMNEIERKNNEIDNLKTSHKQEVDTLKAKIKELELKQPKTIIKYVKR